MTKDVATYITLGLLVPLFGKIIWDWLKNSRNGKKEEKESDKIIQLFDKFKGELRITNENQAKILTTINVLNDNIKWLREIHDNRDDNGVPLWFYPKGLHNAIIKAIEGISNDLKRFTDFSLRDNTETNVYINKILERIDNLNILISKIKDDQDTLFKRIRIQN